MFTLNIEAVSFKDLSSPYLEKQPKFKSFSIGGKKKNNKVFGIYLSKGISSLSVTVDLI